MEIHTIGIDLGKTLFHLVGVDASGTVVVRKRCSRKQLLAYTANIRVQRIGMEACSGSHFLGRALQQQGHDVRLIPAQYVKPYVKTNKSDYIDAEAIAEAVQRPTMRFVPIKTEEQLDLQAVHLSLIHICHDTTRGNAPVPETSESSHSWAAASVLGPRGPRVFRSHP